MSTKRIGPLQTSSKYELVLPVFLHKLLPDCVVGALVELHENRTLLIVNHVGVVAGGQVDVARDFYNAW